MCNCFSFKARKTEGNLGKDVIMWEVADGIADTKTKG
jgi:hypothetical protein